MSHGRTTDEDRPPGRRVAHLAVIAAGAAATVSALILLWALAWGLPDADATPVRLEEWFDPAAVAADRPFRRGLWALSAAGLLAVPAAALALALTGSRWRAPLVRAARTRVWRAGAMLGAALALALHAFLVPLQGLRFAWGHRHGVLVQSTPGWAWDQALALGVRILLFTALGAAVAVLVARLPRTWWIALGALVAALSVALVALTPHLVTPLFERTEPLADPRLRAEVLTLADRAGVGAGDVRVSDASARTTTANARVEGLGAGRRIVLYDTLLDGFPPAQVRTVVAHELAHVQAGHIVKGTAWAAGLALPVCLVFFGIVGSRTGFGAPGRGEAGCELVVRRTMIIAVCAAMVGLVSLPLQNAVSRSFEREADVLALELTDDPGAAIALQQGLVRRARAVPDPPRAIVWLLGTHPPALERIGIALARKNGSSWHDER